MRRERYEAQAEKLLAPTQHSAHPNAAARLVIEHLERQADNAETWQARMEEYLARAVDAMGRADRARRAAAAAKVSAARVEGERQRAEERLRKNARARERYRQRRLTEPPRANKRTGMHALAIEVDPRAYAAVKLEARRRGTAIPKVIGAALKDDLCCECGEKVRSVAPRWRRTREGRRANQHTRIEVDDLTWGQARTDALRAGLTLARRIGIAVERAFAGLEGHDGSGGAPRL